MIARWFRKVIKKSIFRDRCGSFKISEKGSKEKIRYLVRGQSKNKW